MPKICRYLLRTLRQVSLLFVLALAAVACTGLEFETVPLQTVPEVGPSGVVEVAAGEAIQIRSLQTLSVLGEIGTPSLRAVELALADYGPIKGHDVSMGAGLDSLCSGAGGLAAADTVVGDPRVVGVIGTTCSVAATAALPILSEAGLVIISPTNTAPSLTSDLHGNAGANYHPGYYRPVNNDIHEAHELAHFAYVELGLRKMATIHDGDPYTSGITDAFTAEFEEFGGTVTSTSVSRGDTDMVPVLTEIASGSPDGLFLPLFPDEASHMVRQIGQVTGLEDVTLIGGAGVLTPSFLAVPESEGIYLPGPDLNFGSNANETTGKTFDDLLDDYETRYGEAPTSNYMVHAYDATTMLLRAIEEVAIVEGESLYIERSQLRKTLTSLRDFKGIIGVITCDEFGDCGTGRVQISHHTDSNMTDISALLIVHLTHPD